MIPRLVIAGTNSGAGKTTVATGLMAAFAARGLRTAGFKVGPDFIDPGYHSLACGRPGRNLDAYMSGPDLVAPLFRHGSAGAEVAVVEGVMGAFDGATGHGELASSAHVAKLLDAPLVLVVNAASAGRSVAAVVHGFATFDPGVRVGAVVLNRVGSDRHEAICREAIEPLGIPVLGALRRDAEVSAPERHLGLVPIDERRARAEASIARLAALVERSCDLDGLRALAATAPHVPGPAWSPEAAAPPGAGPAPVRVAIARGPAFSFHYRENFELLAAAGAELVDFDPLSDEALPAGTEALILAGGFPEVYGEGLSANAELRAEVTAFARAGGVVLAECGGLLYLSEALDGRPMCGVLPATARMGDRLALGYREAVALTSHPAWPAGTAVRGHEFHYSRLEPAAGEAPAWALRGRPEGFVVGGVHASYLHTHWAAEPAVASRLVAGVVAARERRSAVA
ncbi:MAG TPA: cobyrinate a,c-diamide synthase [Solirubrobacteraceae bacterium]|nr:cobyrinate a,c-diamide synthase [Solirubrobacteraceae bacterium]